MILLVAPVLRDQIELDVLSGELTNVVEQALRPAKAAVWLRAKGS